MLALTVPRRNPPISYIAGDLPLAKSKKMHQWMGGDAQRRERLLLARSRR